MKKLFASTVLTGMLAFGTAVSAEETVEVVDPGTTPDSFLFTFDQLMEKFQLLITFDDEKEAQLLLEFANERLAEATAMSEEEKVEYVQKAVEEYLVVLEQAQDLIAEVIVEEGTDAEGAADLTEELENVSDIDGELAEEVDGELQEEVEEATQEAQAVANVVRNLDQEKVAELREQSLGYGQIAQIFWLAEASGMDVSEVSALYTEEKIGFGKAAKQLGLHPSQLKGLAKKGDPATEEDEVTEEEPGAEEGTVEEGSDATADQPDSELVTEETTEAQVNMMTAASLTTENTTEKTTSAQKTTGKAEEKKAEATKKAEEKKTEEVKKAEEKKEEAAKKAEEKKAEAMKKAEEKKQQADDEEEDVEDQDDEKAAEASEEDSAKGKGKKDSKK